MSQENVEVVPSVRRTGPKLPTSNWFYYAYPHSRAVCGPKWTRNGHERARAGADDDKNAQERSQLKE